MTKDSAYAIYMTTRDCEELIALLNRDDVPLLNEISEDIRVIKEMYEKYLADPEHNPPPRMGSISKYDDGLRRKFDARIAELLPTYIYPHLVNFDRLLDANQLHMYNGTQM